MTDEVLYGAAQIARALGLRPRVVYHRAAAGQLPTFKIGATLCAKRSSLAAWLDACGTVSSKPKPTSAAHTSA